MKRILSTLLGITLFFSLTAQTEQTEWCGTEEMLKAYHAENPEAAERYKKDILATANTRINQQKSNHKIIIPVVIHVIHYNGQGNISKAQIEDGIRQLNEDFNKLNADTTQIRQVFQGLATSTDIEFRLAKKDPNGSCTEGITRTNSYLAMGPSNRNAPKTLIGWDPFRYMNVWIVPAFNSPTLGGFAQFPSPNAGPASTYGLIVKSDEWGTIGTGTQGTFGGRAVTHEFGHCLELFHPFQSGCGSLCQGTGDLVCDTPPQISSLNNSCNFSFNSCSNDASGGNALNTNPFTSNVPDQLENFMGYGIGCQVMYTQGQKERMLRAINTYQKLITLTDTANQTFTGTNNGYVSPDCTPTAEILSFDKFICAGDNLQFTEDSYGGPLTNFNWSFPGGTPNSSTQQQPTITYNTPGDYDVILRVSNSGGVDSVILTDYVHVEGAQATYSGFNYVESFENATSFANDWTIVSPSGNPGFDRSNFAAKTGSASLWLNNLNNVYVTGKDQIISPSIKMSDVLNPSISVDVAYRRKNSSSNDKLNFYASIDCGKTWITILSTTPAFFAYDNSTQTSNFFPTQGSQWKNVTIPTQFIPVSIRNADRVKFRFEVEYGGGNNFYLDDFKILGQATGIDETKAAASNELTMYPNPADEAVTLLFSPKAASAQSQIYLTNLLGERVREIFSGNMEAQEYKFMINTDDLSKGVYFLSIDTDHGRLSEKLIVK